MSDTLKDFLVSLGWEFNEQSHNRFVNAIRTAEVQAKLLADALEALARKIWDSVSQTAEAFDQLHFAVQRTGATAATIRDMGYAVGQLGGSAQAAQASLEGMAQKLRENKGNIYYVEQLGLHFNKLTGELEDSEEGLRRFQELYRRNPNVAEQIRAGAGMDVGTYLARANPNYQKFRDEAKAARKLLGFDPNQAEEDANKFMTTWRRVENDLTQIADNLLTKLMAALDEPFKELKKFLDANAGQIKEDVELIAKAFGDMAAGWVNSFEKILKDPKSMNDFQNTMHKLAEDVADLVRYFGKFVDMLRWIDEKGSAIVDTLNKIAGGGTTNSGSFWDAPWNHWNAGGGAGANHIMPDSGTPAAPAPGPETYMKRPGHLRRLWNWMTGSGGDQSGEATPATPGSTSYSRYYKPDQQSRIFQMMDRLVKVHGWTPEAAAIAVGNAVQESNVQTNGPAGDGGRSKGLMQWDAVRTANGKAWAAANGKNWFDLDTQVDWFNEERQRRGGLEAQWHTMKDFSQAGRVGWLFERYSDMPSMPTRVRNAQAALGAYNARNAAGAETAGNGAYTEEGKTDKGRFVVFPNGRRRWVGWGNDPLSGGPVERLPDTAKPTTTWGAVDRDAFEGDKQIKQWEKQSAPWGKLNNFQNYWDATKPLGMSDAGSSSNVTIHSKNEFNIDGANDPSIVAHMVAANQDRINGDLSRNMIGATG